jgi:hypothetical protein
VPFGEPEQFVVEALTRPGAARVVRNRQEI